MSRNVYTGILTWLSWDWKWKLLIVYLWTDFSIWWVSMVFLAQSKCFEHFERFSLKSIWIISSCVSILHPEAKSIATFNVSNQFKNKESKTEMGAAWWSWKGGDSRPSKQIVKGFEFKRAISISRMQLARETEKEAFCQA